MPVTPTLPRFCPDCGHEFQFLVGLCGYRHLQAIALQSARIGVEIQCRQCKNMFVLTRTESLPKISETERQRRNTKRREREHDYPQEESRSA